MSDGFRSTSEAIAKVPRRPLFHPLTNFIRTCIESSTKRGITPNKEIVRILRELEILLLDSEEVFSKIEAGGINGTSWYGVYTTLCALKDNQVFLVLDRLIVELESTCKDAKQIGDKSEEKASEELDLFEDHFKKMILVIRSE